MTRKPTSHVEAMDKAVTKTRTYLGLIAYALSRRRRGLMTHCL